MINPPLSVGADDSTPMTIDTEGDRSTELPSTEELGPSGVSATTQTAGSPSSPPAAAGAVAGCEGYGQAQSSADRSRSLPRPDHDTDLATTIGAAVLLEDDMEFHGQDISSERIRVTHKAGLRDRTQYRIENEIEGLDEEHRMVGRAAALKLIRLTVKNFENFIHKYRRGVKPWPGSAEALEHGGVFDAPTWDAHLDDKLTLLLQALRSGRATKLLQTQIRNNPNMQEVHPINGVIQAPPTNVCPECGEHLAVPNKEQQCQGCFNYVIPDSHEARNARCIKTHKGWMIQDPETKVWVLQDVPEGTEDKTMEIIDDYGCDLSQYTRAPEADMTEEDLANLREVLTDIAKRKDVPPDLENKIQRMSERDPESMSRQRIETIMKELHNTNAIKIETYLEPGEEPTRSETTSFNPHAANAMMEMGIKPHSVGTGSWVKINDPDVSMVSLEEDSDVEAMITDQKGAPQEDEDKQNTKKALFMMAIEEILDQLTEGMPQSDLPRMIEAARRARTKCPGVEEALRSTGFTDGAWPAFISVPNLRQKLTNLLDSPQTWTDPRPTPPAPKPKKRKTHMNAIGQIKDLLTQVEDPLDTMDTMENLAEKDPKFKDVDFSQVLRSSEENREADSQSKEQWAQSKIDLDPYTKGEHRSIWGTYAPYVERGIHKTARMVDLGANAHDATQPLITAHEQTVSTQKILKRADRSKWRKTFGTPYPLDTARLWDDSPKLSKLNRPPQNEDEKRKLLESLSKRFTWQLRHLFSEWYMVDGPVPEGSHKELPADLIDKTLTSGGYSTNYWGALLMNKLNDDDDDAKSEHIGNTYIYGKKGAPIWGNSVPCLDEGDYDREEDQAAAGSDGTRKVTLTPRLEVHRRKGDKPLPPNFGKIYTPLIAESTTPDKYHWQRRVATFSWDQLLSENQQNCTLNELLYAWHAMPLLHKGGNRGMSSMITQKRKEREATIREHASAVADFFQVGQRVTLKDMSNFRKCVQLVINTVLNLSFAEPDEVGRVMSMPISATTDSKSAMRMRCEYDERLSFPLDALLQFTMHNKGGDITIGEYLKVKTGTKQRAAAFRFYRCPFKYCFQLPGDRTLGPFQCGSVLSSLSDWLHITKTTGKVKNVWQCKKCLGDWMKGKSGTRMLQILTADWLMNIILDEPPEGLEAKWQNDRIAYYQRCEPHDAPRDVKPLLLPTKVQKRIQLTGEDSATMWRLVMANHELADYKEIRDMADRALANEPDEQQDDQPDEEARLKLEKLTIAAVNRAMAGGGVAECYNVWKP